MTGLKTHYIVYTQSKGLKEISKLTGHNQASRSTFQVGTCTYATVCSNITQAKKIIMILPCATLENSKY